MIRSGVSGRVALDVLIEPLAPVAYALSSSRSAHTLLCGLAVCHAMEVLILANPSIVRPTNQVYG